MNARLNERASVNGVLKATGTLRTAVCRLFSRGVVGMVAAAGVWFGGLGVERAWALVEPQKDTKQATPNARSVAADDLGSLRESKDVQELWYVLLLDGQRAGYMISRQGTTKEGIISQGRLLMQIKRGATSLSLSYASEFVETPEGKPVRMSTTQSIGAGVIQTDRIFTPEGKVKVVITAGGQQSESLVDAPEGQWFTPAAGEREMKAQAKAGKKEITLRMVDPSSGDEPIGITRKLIGPAVVEVFGRDVPAMKYAMKVDRFADVEVTEYLTEDFRSVRSEINLGGMKMEQVLADKDLALSKLNAPELMVSTLVRPDKAIPNARTSTRAVYELSIDGGKVDVEQGAGQTVERLSESRIRVVVEPAASAAVKLSTAQRGELLRASTMLNHEDPMIREMLVKYDDPKLPVMERIERLRGAVHTHISAKDFSVGLATASETVRTGKGDCTEHGVLLAALLRGAGIPARVASGLIYVPQLESAQNVFGYHMWAQALITWPDGEERWVNLDATFPEKAPFDATHIIIETSAMNGTGIENQLVRMAPMLGQLKIRVVEVR
ncbi:MAG: transglutaminase domain-containing protein [Phycisphaerales bacterium]|nr:transglutaminase domain-containing protein [Phycisphaerales bacterium]